MRANPSTPRIALIVNYLDRSYQIRFRSAFETAAQARGVELVVAVGRELDHAIAHERALNRIYDWLSTDSVDGVAVMAGIISNFTGLDGVQRLCRSLAPLPHCSIGLRMPGVPSIVLDNRAAMRAAAMHLVVEHGCRRLAYVGGPDYNEEARERLLGYRDALEGAGIPFDESRVAFGHFTRETGHAALAELYARDPSIDGVAVANDDMAIGALDALVERGRRVPEDVKMVGFDDVPVARLARRSLTTIAQPIDEMAAMALDGLLDTLRGGSPSAVTSVRMGRIVTRESCGCGYVLSAPSTRAVAPDEPASVYLRTFADETEQRLAQDMGVHVWETLLPQLAWGLASELEGNHGAFLRCVEHVADAASMLHSVDSVSRALVELRRRCYAAGYQGTAHHHLERACLEAQAKASAMAHREQGRRAIRVMDDAATLRSASQELAMVLSSPALAESFEQALRRLGITTGYLAVCADDEAEALRPLIAIESGKPVDVDGAVYPARQLFPRGFPRATPWSLMLQPLTVENQVMGLVAFASQTEAFVCEALRSQLSAAIKLGALHARVVSETAMRERLASERLLGEVATARRIQSALCPRQLGVAGFEIAAQLIAADQVGGDYYDVMPTPDGCWVGIGDVTGHGLLAGLIMLMIQSSAGTAVLADPDQSPSNVLCRVNTLVQSNIRGRLDASEHATLTILRAHADGRMVMAGAHEDVIVHRKATGVCELIPTDGVWVGISADIRSATRDQTFRLEPGDTVVLYTDGLIEARDAQAHEFDIQRACSIIAGAAPHGPRAVIDALFAGVRAWTPVQQDDVTVLAMRRNG